MAMIQHCLLIVVTLPISFSMWEDYITGKGGIKWLPNCDFPGFDIVQKYITQEKCGQICITTTHINGCNSFSWKSGWCYLKKIPAHSLNRQPLSGGSCGVLPWEFENEDVTDPGNDPIGRIDLNITVPPPQIKCAYIKNFAFEEYLFADDDLHDENSRLVYTRRSKGEGNPPDWSSTGALWILEQEGQENMYSIKNAYHQELLYASDCRFAHYGRQVFTWSNPARFNQGHLHWELEDSMANTFYIKNRMFDEYMYAVEDALSFDPLRRNVYTWTKSQEVGAWAGVGDWQVETATCPR